MQLHDLLAALQKSFPSWPEELKNIFVFRGISEDIAVFARSLDKVIDKQQDLARRLNNLPVNQRRDALISNKAKSEIPNIPVVSDVHVLADGLYLTHTPKCLQDHDSGHPLMTEDERFILSFEESPTTSAFNSRNSSTEHLSPRQAIVDMQIFQSPAAIAQFQMRTTEEILDLLGGDVHKSLEKYIPIHDSIGTFCSYVHFIS